MRTVRAERALDASVHDAKTCWYDTSRWPAWVNGLARVLEVSDDWPAPGASVTWQSGPAGRGRVTERVRSVEPLGGQTLEVRDDSISGVQTVSFTPLDSGCAVALSLAYEITERSAFTPVVDALFIRRAMERSLASTLEHFAVELGDRRAADRR
jgi:hypothetical protein